MTIFVFLMHYSNKITITRLEYFFVFRVFLAGGCGANRVFDVNFVFVYHLRCNSSSNGHWVRKGTILFIWRHKSRKEKRAIKWLKKGVSFINMLCSHFLYKIWVPKITKVCLGFVIFLPKICTKNTRDKCWWNWFKVREIVGTRE